MSQFIIKSRGEFKELNSSASRNAPPWTITSSMYSGALVLDLSWAVGGTKVEERAHNE